MKSKKNFFYKAAFLSALVFFLACESATDEEFGSALLYIPQAVVKSGGVNNDYIVRLKVSMSEDTIVAVGLYRSGLQKLEAVTVDLIIDEEALNEAIANSATDNQYALYKNAQLLPEAFYSIPATISLKNGERDSWVELRIKKAILLQQWANPDIKYVLPIRIVNPTRYELNEKLSIAMFVFQKD